jgi:hypothetical protein
MSAIRSFVLVVLVFTLAAGAAADEGMWPLYSLDKLPFDSLRARGLMLTPDQIYSPKGGGIADAVVQVGATGSFVSPDGLILTNHHVAFGAIQQQSTVEQNYLRDGFYAAARGQEPEAIGYKASVTLGIEDVSARVLAVVTDKIKDIDRYKAIDQEIKKIVKECETGRDVKCRVATMFDGKQYVKYTFLEIRDVRIVYVPPDAIGKYGGEIDNWIWPRHTGDFSFLRAYVSPDGKPADYAKENVPFNSKVFLPISTGGIQEHDFAMTIGFPGGTDRYISSFELENAISFSYPNSIRNAEDQIRIMTEAGARDSAIALRLASDVASLNNRLKKNYGVVEGLARSHVLDRKQSDERGLIAFLAANPPLNKKFGKVLPELDSLYRADKKSQRRDYALGQLVWGSDYARMANTIYRWAVERAKPDLERERGFMNRDTLTAKERLKNAQINLVPSVDKEILKYFLRKTLAVPAGQKIDAIEKLFPGASSDERDKQVDRWVEDAYAKTLVGSAEERLRMFAMSKNELEQLHDPLIDLAAAIHPLMEQMRERDKAFSGAQTRLAPKLVQAFSEWKKDKMYPDANGTMRLSYGEVAGYAPRDAVAYTYHTDLTGEMDKETGSDPFIIPDPLKRAYSLKDFGKYVDTHDSEMPVNFLTTNDITGGNSGSPVINGKGELIGVAFDGNYEAVACDYLFDAAIDRTISVDIRYILFIIDKVYHLDGLLKEMTVR